MLKGFVLFSYVLLFMHDVLNYLLTICIVIVS